MEETTKERMCYDCGKSPAYQRSSYCGKCIYIRQTKSVKNAQERRDARITAGVTINVLSSEIEGLIEELSNSPGGAEKLYLKTRLSMQTKNLSYLALSFAGKNGK